MLVCHLTLPAIILYWYSAWQGRNTRHLHLQLYISFLVMLVRPTVKMKQFQIMLGDRTVDDEVGKYLLVRELLLFSHIRSPSVFWQSINRSLTNMSPLDFAGNNRLVQWGRGEERYYSLLFLDLARAGWLESWDWWEIIFRVTAFWVTVWCFYYSSSHSF